MELHEIRYFLAVGRLGSFTKAAEQCCVTQPALTRAIQKLEDELGGLLVSRERGRVHLTDLGRLLEPEFSEMIERRERAKRAASRFLRLEGAELRLGVMCTIGPLRFVGFLNHFRVHHPGIELTLVEGVPARLTEMLLGGELDVAIMADPRGFPEPLRASPLYAERFMLACGPAHAFACRNAIRMHDLAGQIYLQRINCEFRDLLAEILRAQGTEILRSHRSEREDWIQSMVAAGMGVCFLPEFSATQPGLALLPVVEPAVAREVCLVTVAGRRRSAPLSALAAALGRYAWPASRFCLDDEAV
ncbi:LysR family transcriptional regulator [Methylobacterium oxalidis]|uniref:Transcriptional regulator n=1 Tax=Methylobacterium oxalidis TaxID=944322 RepID=A0A512J0Y9_9HYPH|nr:LysR family transcriptional regulator [Methylobacterium oxalidis]GEP03624.1 transcriptional regulator [Methylobacterium oxalidis]GJE34331.1 Hydrogen peroxide-inducible genes activator [Methylobacterium oxalidis]GLS64951.1 transcriptional regulator [Methylobacterium oxalidis]